MYEKSMLTVSILAIALAFSLIMPHPAHAADQSVTLDIKGMT